jgi:hypothetical protein
VKPDAPIETELVGILESFCAGFADRDAEAVMRLFGPDPEAVVVISEEFVLRGRPEAAPVPDDDGARAP